MDDAALPPTTNRSETDKDGDVPDDPPELVPTFMPTVRRVISRFLGSKKKPRGNNRRRRGLRALLSRLAFRSKFLSAPAAPPAPKPKQPEPPSKPPRGPNRPLRGRFNRPSGP